MGGHFCNIDKVVPSTCGNIGAVKRSLSLFFVFGLLAASCSSEGTPAPPTTTVGDLFADSQASPTVPPLEVPGWEKIELSEAREAAETCVASARPPEIVLPDEGPETVMVEAGDSLGKIAERFNSTVDAFMRANALNDPNKLRVGQMLLIPREREDEVEGQVGPAITMEEVDCVISTGVDAYGPTGEPTGTTGRIEIAITWPRIEGPREAPQVNGRLLGLTQGAVNEFLDDAISSVEDNGYACREGVTGRCVWLEHEYEILLSNDELLSMRNTVSQLVSGAAGESATIRTETFDLFTGEPLSIVDLFDPETDWVEAVSAEAITRLGSEPWVDERRFTGASPDAINFTLYNLTQGGLVLSFAPYSVGGSGSNTVSITIPYRSLEGYWVPNGLVADLLAAIE